MTDDLDAIALLADPARRAAYRVVVEAAPEPVGRDEVAAALGVGRTLAAFHLDKLVAAGLLEASFARRTGRTGPGAGRPAKLYRRAAADHEVTVPPRRYLSAAELLAEAVERAGADEALYAVALAHGREDAVPGADLVQALTDRGYEPTVDADADEETIRLRNCPFHVLAGDFPPLVCGMNLALVSGLVEGTDWQARLEPTSGHCCVALSKSNSTSL